MTLAIVGALTLLVALLKGVFSQKNAVELIRVICDSFFLTGFFALSLGGLIVCSSKGAFDALSYLVYSFFVNHNWSKTKFKDKKTYIEYVQEKREKSNSAPSYLLLVGLIYIAISIVFLIVYYNV